MYGIVYTITNKENGKQYVGQTTWVLRKRWNAHVAYANRKDKPPYLLCQAIRKYGRQAFVVEQVDQASSLEELNNKEVEWILKLNTFGFDSGYNMTEGGKCCRHLNKTGRIHPMYGKRHSEETRRKMRENHNHISGEAHWSTGKKKSPITLEKMRKASLGRKQTVETIAKRVEKITGELSSRAKWYKIFSPDGTEFFLKSLRHFCIENDLNYHSLANTIRRGTAISSGPSKGWKVELI